MSRPIVGIFLFAAAVFLHGCGDEQQGFGPGDATASETRALSDAAEMAAQPRPTSKTNAPLPQTAGDKAPNQGQ